MRRFLVFIRISAGSLLLLAAWFVSPAPAAVGADTADLRTTAEKSRFARTGRYEEVPRLCAAYAARWPQQARCAQFGRTPEGRPMMLLVVSADGRLDAAANRAANRPVVFLQGGIHAGEIDGKDAGFRFLRDLLDGKAARGAHAKATIVFVPVFNVDGHERFARWNRPNQTGPDEMGWRATAQNLNLNRDYTKADAPEMQAMLRLLDEWDPIVYADLHVTDGADFEHDISITVEPTLAGDTQLAATAREVQQEIIAQLASGGSLPLDFYPSLLREDEPSSGFAVSVSTPRFSTGYWAQRNRIGVLVETHSWKPYQIREDATYRTIAAIVTMAANNGPQWRAVAAAADGRAAQLAGSALPLAFENDDHVTMLDFRGYAYDRRPSAISGGLVTRYDPKRKQIWRVPLRDGVRATATAMAPRAGYVVMAGYADGIGQRLRLHGIEFVTLAAARAAAAFETFRADKVTWSASSFEGRVPMSLQGQWRAETRAVPPGSLFVPIAQAKARLVMMLLEPASPDSFLSWGMFTSAFERKEYMESYVAEQVGEQMMAKDPAVRAEFERRLATDAAFAANPRARLEFFHRLHASFDERFNLYPVYRSDLDLTK